MLSSDEVNVEFLVIGRHGVILRIGRSPLSLLDAQAGPDEMAMLLPEGVSDDTHYWRDGGFYPYPPRPGDWAEWNGHFWIDPRPSADGAADLAAAGEVAWVSKADFLLNCKSADVLSQEEAAQAALGIIPASFADAVADMPAGEIERLQIIWPTVTRIDRLDPFITAIAARKGVPETVLDLIFRVIPHAEFQP